MGTVTAAWRPVAVVTRRLGVLALVLAAFLATAPAAAAVDPTFEAAEATATFGEGIVVRQEATIPDGVHRVEAIVRTGVSDRTFLSTIPTPAVGATTLDYTFEIEPGSIYPNTLVELGFRFTLEDGRIVDGPTTSVRYEDTRFAWATLEGTLVRVHYYRGDQAFGRRALAIGEQAIEEATALLGVTEDEPIDFFVYSDRDEFYDVLGPALQENVGGIALPEIRTMFANITPAQVNDQWVGIVIPHELTHLVFETATANVYHEPLHWLDEGLADYIATGYNAGARANVERAARNGEIMPLRAIVGRFPAQADRFSLAYDESVSAIDYLVRTHGQDALVQLIGSYANGVGDDEAFTAALGVDVAGFEAGWLADLGIDEPVPFGPRPAPPGPLPPGWKEAPIPTVGPGIATPPPSPGPVGEDTGFYTLVAVAGAVIVALLAAGIFIVARGLNRGEPLMAPAGSVLPQADDEPDRVGDAWQIGSVDGLGALPVDRSLDDRPPGDQPPVDVDDEPRHDRAIEDPPPGDGPGDAPADQAPSDVPDDRLADDRP